MLSTTLLATGGVAFVGVVAAVATYRNYRKTTEHREEQFEALLENALPGEPLEFEPPDTNAGLLGFLSVWRHLRKSKRLAKKGYVKWYRLDSTLGRPQWVRPEQEGAGVPKVTDGGQPYYFPRDAMVADSVTGAWVAMHREGEGDPINLRDPAYPGMETDLVERTINLEAEDKPPGLFDNLFGGMSQTTLMYLLIAVMFVIYAGYRYMGGAM